MKSKRRLRPATGKRPLKIFISHSHRDKDAIDRIAARLRAQKYEVWMDRLQLKAGDNIQRRIHEELVEADVLLVVLSANSFKSSLVQHEFSTIALQEEVSRRKRQIIPIKIDDTPVPSYIAHLHYLDFSQDFEAGLDRLILDLQRRPPQTSKAATAEEGRDAQLRSLRDSHRRGRLTLVCGAGVSMDAGLPSWQALLVRLLDRVLAGYSTNLGRNAAVQFKEDYGASSSLILGKYLKNNLGDDFANEIREALYLNVGNTSRLIDSIVNLSRPQRDTKPLESIITFNFDNLIEDALGQNSIANRSIFSEAIRHADNELPVYHVHGFLPRAGNIPTTELVFSEDAYHSQFMDTFSWSNLIQLNKLTQNTCLFIGISLTDPNMRRLLDVAWRKNPDKTISHFLIKERPNHRKDSELDRVARLLAEQDANLLGLKVIWVDNVKEIPDVLNGIAN